MIEIMDTEYKMISDYIQDNYGIKLGAAKKTLIKGRLQNVLTDKKMNSFAEYFNYVMADKSGAALTEMVNKITTNYTYFMREERHFFYYRDYVLPYFAENQASKELRIWCAGCSTGEEAYTLGMLTDEYLKARSPFWNYKILATDISDRALEAAKKGEYVNSSLEVLPTGWRAEYFKKIDDEKSVVSDKLKNKIKIGYFNLMNTEFPFAKKFQVIFCRNVMIYFENSCRDALVKRFYDLLEPGGYLFIGHSEALSREKTAFEYIMPAVYRKGL